MGQAARGARARAARLPAALSFLGAVLPAALGLACARQPPETPLVVTSPNGAVEIVFGLDPAGRPSWALRHDGHVVLEPSPLGLELRGAEPLVEGFEVVDSARRSQAEALRIDFGERARAQVRYSELRVALAEREAGRRLELVFRAYDRGAAFRYALPPQPGAEEFVIAGERSALRFGRPLDAWAQVWSEARYEKLDVGAIPKRSVLPLTLEDPGAGAFYALAEVDLEGYARAFVRSDPSSPHTLRFGLEGPVRGRPPLDTAWRVLLLATSPAALLESNPVLHDLAPASRLADTSWIEPGKAMRVARKWMTTEGARAVVDFARDAGLQYVELDAGWYGKGYGIANESDPDSDATRPVDGLDVAAVAAYAAEHDIGLILYVNKVALEGQLDALLPLYRGWGVRGLKFGFVDALSQDGLQNVHDWVEAAARHQLVVDVHDRFRPTGASRSWPNLLTQEGVLGNEHMPSSRHNATLPFTRFVSGAADYTIAYLNRRLRTSNAHQLALAVVFFSPLQFVYWYGSPDGYRESPGVEFFRRVPTVWDETRVLAGSIGEFAAVARRSGRGWFVGAITNEEPRTLELPLDFLDPETQWQASFYRDSADRELDVSSQQLHAGEPLREQLRADGGVAIVLSPIVVD